MCFTSLMEDFWSFMTLLSFPMSVCQSSYAVVETIRREKNYYVTWDATIAQMRKPCEVFRSIHKLVF